MSVCPYSVSVVQPPHLGLIWCALMDRWLHCSVNRTYHLGTAACRALQRHRSVRPLSAKPLCATAPSPADHHQPVTSWAQHGSGGGMNRAGPADGEAHGQDFSLNSLKTAFSFLSVLCFKYASMSYLSWFFISSVVHASVLLYIIHLFPAVSSIMYLVCVCTCLRGLLAVGVGLSADLSSCRRAPTLWCETANCSSHTSLTRSMILMWRSPGDAHGWLETQDAAGLTSESPSISESSSATQRCSLWTCRRLEQVLFQWWLHRHSVRLLNPNSHSDY